MKKLENSSILTLCRWVSHGKEWAAKITGRDPKYGWARQFCKVVERRWSRSGKNGETDVQLDGDGYYQISDPNVGKYGSEAYQYARVVDGQIEYLAKADWESALDAEYPMAVSVYGGGQ